MPQGQRGKGMLDWCNKVALFFLQYDNDMIPLHYFVLRCEDMNVYFKCHVIEENSEEQ